MRYYRVTVAVPFDEDMSPEKAMEKILTWLKTNDGTQSVVLEGTALDFDIADSYHRVVEERRRIQEAFKDPLEIDIDLDQEPELYGERMPDTGYDFTPATPEEREAVRDKFKCRVVEPDHGVRDIRSDEATLNAREGVNEAFRTFHEHEEDMDDGRC